MDGVFGTERLFLTVHQGDIRRVEAHCLVLTTDRTARLATHQEIALNRIAPAHHPDRPTLIVFGGGKGGVGRSTLCAEIARSLVRQHTQRVLCVDASWTCPTLNTFLHAPSPLVALEDEQGIIPSMDEDGSHIADFICETANPNIHLVSLAAARAYPFMRPGFPAQTLIEQLHQLDFSTILIDLGPELDPFHVGLFTLSDIPLLVCSPEPAAVRVTTQFLRAVLSQALSFKSAMVPDPDLVLNLLYNLPIDFNLEILRDMAGESSSLQQLITSTLSELETYLIINLVREGAERDLGYVLSHAWYKELGTFPRFLTPVDYEDRRWFYNRRHAGLSNSRGDEALSHDIEQLVRAISNIHQTDASAPRPIPSADPKLPVALQLGLHPDTNTNLVRQHCRRIWEGYRRETTISLAFRNPDDRTHLADAIEQLYRRAIPLPGEPTTSSAPSNASPTGAQSAQGRHPSLATPPPAPSAETANAANAVSSPDRQGRTTGSNPGTELPEAGSPGEFHAQRQVSPGQLIERLRRQHTMSLQELSQRTHIGLKYLTAIEDADLKVLPRSVYLRGYLREIARIFMVDPDQLVAEYFRLLEEIQP